MTEVLDSLEQSLADDPEFLLVAQHMLIVCPWAFLISARKVRIRIRRYGKALRRLGVTALPAEVFSGRGAYGAYYGSIEPIQPR